MNVLGTVGLVSKLNFGSKKQKTCLVNRLSKLLSNFFSLSSLSFSHILHINQSIKFLTPIYSTKKNLKNKLQIIPKLFSHL